jgi:diaminopimelate epimerase
MSFLYEKFCGTGNDFLIVDIRGREKEFDASLQGLSRAQWTAKICDRHFGLGADGLVLLQSSTDLNLKWDFYNSDGSAAEMCGNAARCVGKWAEKHFQNTIFKVETLAGPIQIEKGEDGEFVVQMNPISRAEFQQRLDLPGFKTPVEFSFINSGVPHAVIKVSDLSDRETLRRTARALRSHVHFGPAGTNVTFYRNLSESQIEALSFERGVEDFTLSCGTGAVAAAFEFYKQNKRGEVRVRVPGGDLKVRFFSSSPQLIGPAIKIADCTLCG